MKNNMLLISYGTRPEWIKINPIIKVLKKKKIPFKTLFTGQHITLVNNKADININIESGDNRLDSVVTSILNKDNIFNGIDKIMVQGDTVSAFSLALASFHRNIPVIHLEAGLRTYDINNPYPEEFYRRSISSISNIHLCPTKNNLTNLLNEKINGKKFVVGNTIIDNLLPYSRKITYNNEIIITLHRRENNNIIKNWFLEIENLSNKNNKYNFIFIAHPNPNIQNNLNIFKNVKVINPLSYEKMIKKISCCKMLISDSGGIQEESSFFKKHVIICRKITERPESIGLTSWLCKNYKYLSKLFNSIIDMKPSTLPCPYGDGKSSERIVNILYENI